MFSKFEQYDSELENACRITVKEVFKAKKGEKALIITNDEHDVFTIAKALYDEFQKEHVCVTLMIQPVKTLLDFSEESVSMAIRSEPDMIISLSAEKLGKDSYAMANPYMLDGKPVTSAFHYLQGTKKSRSFWAPGVTLDIYRKAVPIDYQRLVKESDAVKKVLDQADSVHITTEAGMDFYIGTKGRLATADNGAFDVPGEGGNLPAGETYISPVNGSCHGTIVFDGSLALKAGTVLATEPVKVLVKNGFVAEVTGGKEARMLLDTIEAGEKLAMEWEAEGKLPKGEGAEYARNARHIGELGIGLNPAATLIGNMLIDEKAYNTCHIAIGSNYDDDANSLIHQDCVCKNPTIIATMADGSTVTILEKGLLKV